MQTPPALPGSGGPSEPLEELVFEFLERRANGERDPLEQLCRAHPACAEGLRARVQLLLLLGAIESGPSSARAPNSE